MKRFADIFLRALLTGFAIGIGGIVYLSCESRYIGSFLFGTGLFVILNFGFNLFTGKVGYAVENKPAYLIDLALIWLGNLAGTAATGIMTAHTRISGIGKKAAELCDVKLSDGPVSILILSFFCGMLMFIAADGFKRSENPTAQVLMVFLPVMVFILCGFEHCVANMYFVSAGLLAVQNPHYLQLAQEAGVDLSALTVPNFLLGNLLPVTLGNILGGAGLAVLLWYAHLKKD